MKAVKRIVHLTVSEDTIHLRLNWPQPTYLPILYLSSLYFFSCLLYLVVVTSFLPLLRHPLIFFTHTMQLARDSYLYKYSHILVHILIIHSYAMLFTADICWTVFIWLYMYEMNIHTNSWARFWWWMHFGNLSDPVVLDTLPALTQQHVIFVLKSLLLFVCRLLVLCCLLDYIYIYHVIFIYSLTNYIVLCRFLYNSVNSRCFLSVS